MQAAFPIAPFPIYDIPLESRLPLLQLKSVVTWCEISTKSAVSSGFWILALENLYCYVETLDGASGSGLWTPCKREGFCMCKHSINFLNSVSFCLSLSQKKDAMSWKNHIVRKYDKLYRRDLVQKQFLGAGQCNYSFYIVIFNRRGRSVINLIKKYPSFDLFRGLLPSYCHVMVIFDFLFTIFYLTQLMKTKSIHIEYCTVIDSDVKSQPSSQILSP